MTFSHSSSSASTGVDSTSPHCASRDETSAFSDASGISVMACPSKKARWDKFSKRIHLLHRVGCTTDGRGRAGVGEGDNSPRPRAIVRVARAVWRWLNAQDDSVIEDALGAISLFVLLYAFLAAPFIAGWQ